MRKGNDDLHYAVIALFCGAGGAAFGIMAFALLAKLAQ